MHRYSGKSLVWYPKKAWDAAGYQVPQTWDELLALTQQIADDGDTPWCIGIESGAATGWAGHRLDRRYDAAHHLPGELRQLGRR